jgi:two-component system chemotaxis sensor kinase CheA
MATSDESFRTHLLGIFKLEADEHLKAMSSLLLPLERASADELPAVVETLFREAHSLKGAARAVNLDSIETVCQALENVLAGLKRNEIAPSADLVDVLSRAVDTLQELLSPEGASASTAPLLETLARLQVPEAGPAPGAAAPVPAAGPEGAGARMPAGIGQEASQTVRISTAKLGALLTQAEELLTYKFSAAHLADELRSVHMEMTAWKKTWDKRVRDMRLLRNAVNRNAGGAHPEAKAKAVGRLLDEMEKEEFFAKRLTDRFARIERAAEQDRRTLASMVDSLLEEMKQALMLPFSSLLDMFPRMVRDLARDNGKLVDLAVAGDTLEIDRRILEQMKDPLIHLVRNAVDHGLEKPAERIRAGKPQRGRIVMEIAPRDGNKVELTVTDDGAGIDAARVKGKALALGLISAEAAGNMSERDAMALVFESGLSTSPILTDISGRGLGLAIVREKVEKLGGQIEAEPAAGGGTCFRIVLPTTLATFRGLLVTAGESLFVLPSNSVERVMRVGRDAVKTVENVDSVEIGAEVFGLVRLDTVLGIPPQSGTEEAAHRPVVLLSNGGKRIAFMVDEVLGDQEVLVKGLGQQLLRVPNVAGATVLGPGRVVPILSVPDLLKSALKAGSLPRAAAEPSLTRRKSVLVAEDSITSRALVKNILESAGYEVMAVVDGVDAWTALHERNFDAVVSDVEMPRMDGFGLTERIRADKQLADLPVVLVTALESREHKERGVEAGASAYIVKSCFDQGNLLEVIARLT